MTIFDATISRRHATIELRGDSWVIVDEGSANGCYVEGQRVQGEMRVRDGQRIQLGDVRFFLIDESAAYHVAAGAAAVLGSHTARGALPAPEPEKPQRMTLELREPTGGGGGVAIIDGTSVSLTVPQLELMQLLHDRARQGGDGFVHSSELIRRISLDSSDPNEDHIRQLVRRLRRVLYNAGIKGLIESGYGVGYRLALVRS
jgi:predicted component of type VI protein secretion system